MCIVCSNNKRLRNDRRRKHTQQEHSASLSLRVRQQRALLWHPQCKKSVRARSSHGVQQAQEVCALDVAPSSRKQCRGRTDKEAGKKRRS